MRRSAGFRRHTWPGLPSEPDAQRPGRELTTAYPNGLVTEAGYDGANRLKSVSDGAGLVAEYNDNRDGQRVRKVARGRQIHYYYHGHDLLNEGDGTAITASHVWGLRLISRATGGQVGYYLFNGHRDVVGVVDPAGAELAAYRFDEYGSPVQQSGSFDNPFRYTSEPYDEETGFMYLRARYYSPALGRFITEDSYAGDPQIPWSQHPYLYTGNNPVNRTPGRPPC